MEVLSVQAHPHCYRESWRSTQAAHALFSITTALRRPLEGVYCHGWDQQSAVFLFCQDMLVCFQRCTAGSGCGTWSQSEPPQCFCFMSSSNGLLTYLFCPLLFQRSLPAVTCFVPDYHPDTSTSATRLSSPCTSARSPSLRLSSTTTAELLA